MRLACSSSLIEVTPQVKTYGMPELSVDQALKQGIEAHKTGQLQEADRLYTAILKAQPKHPDANHNMGVLAVGVAKVEQALPFFKTALEANPATAQFWLSYIDALIRLDKFFDAKAVLAQAKNKGAKGVGFDKLEQSLKEAGKKSLVASKTASKAPPQQSNILDALKLDQAIKLAKKKSKEGAVKEAKRIYQDILVKFPRNKRAGDGLKALARGPVGTTFKVQDPPQNQRQSLIKLYSRGQFKHCLQQATALLHKFPNSCFLYNISGVILRALNQLDASIEAYTKALAIKPDYAEAYNNMGNALKDQGKLEEAKEAYKKALANEPDYAEAYNNVGIVLKEQGKLEEAIEAYKKALFIKPDYADAHNNIGNAAREQGRLEEAIAAYTKALTINPDNVQTRHMVSALSGQTTKAPPREYVEKLFDKYAVHFESSLVGELEYCIPRKLTDILLKQSSNASLGSVLDLGCGTGLVGENLNKFCAYLVGVDLSKLMLEQAGQKNVYDKLSHSHMIEYLYNEELDFDYFISTDVFIYVGDLSDVFRAIKSKNKRSGKLVFSTEHTELAGFNLEISGRYSHSKTYIENLCAEFNYELSHFTTTNLRKEKGEFLTGGLYVLDF
jgi:predicted TPR repeat methyltransferase